jgi:hypothetical protein
VAPGRAGDREALTMPEGATLLWLANAVLGLHLALVVFVVGGPVLIVVGNLAHWRWVNGLGFASPTRRRSRRSSPRPGSA